jgi:sugar/nucleoside kinase (ribokinase family)
MTEVALVDMVAVGLNAADTLIPLPEFPARGSKVEFVGQPILAGGQAASAAVACATWGMMARYVGKLGTDDAARLHRKAFEAAQVEARFVEVAGAQSAQSIILVDGDGERTVLLRKDDRLVLRPEEIESEWVLRARLLLTDGQDTDAATHAARLARGAGIPVVADLDIVFPGVDALIENVDFLIVSRDFPLRLARERDLPTALRAIHARYGCRLAAATLGQDGVLAFDGARMLHAAAYRVPVVDTTGAGDVIHAGFIYALHQGWPLERQLDFACAAAALNCTAQGARGGIGPVGQVLELMRAGTRCEVDFSQIEGL